MTTLTIEIPDKKTTLVKQLLKELDVKIVKKAVSKTSNKITQRAIDDAHHGKTEKIANLGEFLKSI
jgi:hypothetical protein